MLFSSNDRIHSCVEFFPLTINTLSGGALVDSWIIYIFALFHLSAFWLFLCIPAVVGGMNDRD